MTPPDGFPDLSTLVSVVHHHSDSNHQFDSEEVIPCPFYFGRIMQGQCASTGSGGRNNQYHYEKDIVSNNIYTHIVMLFQLGHASVSINYAKPIN